MEKIEQNTNQDNLEKKVKLSYKVVEVIDRIGKKIKKSRLAKKFFYSEETEKQISLLRSSLDLNRLKVFKES